MINTMIRGTIIYVAVIAAVRLMGKRQIGELQPSELVITILLSEVAAVALENNSVPMITCLALIFMLASFEVISSDLSIKLPFFRRLIQGNSILVIKNGKIVQKNLKLIRYSVSDLIESLRLKDVFDISDVDFAYIETNGSVSIRLKKNSRPPVKNDSNAKDGIIPYLVISDGKIIDTEFELCNMSKDKIYKYLDEKGIKKNNVLMMTVDSVGNIHLIEKQEESY